MVFIAIVNYIMSLCCLEKATDIIEKDYATSNIYKAFSALSMMIGVVASLIMIGVIK